MLLIPGQGLQTGEEHTTNHILDATAVIDQYGVVILLTLNHKFVQDVGSLVKDTNVQMC